MATGTGRSDQYLGYYSLLRKLSNDQMYLLYCAPFSGSLCTKQTQTIIYKNFLQEVASSQISEVQNPRELSYDEFQWPEKQPSPKGPKQNTPGRLSRDFSQHKLDKSVAGISYQTV
jgi:hypothetical protein